MEHEHSEYCEVYGCDYYARTEEAEARHSSYWEKVAESQYNDSYYYDEP